MIKKKGCNSHFALIYMHVTLAPINNENVHFSPVFEKRWENIIVLELSFEFNNKN